MVTDEIETGREYIIVYKYIVGPIELPFKESEK